MSYDDGMPAGGNSRFRGYPARMSERQQLALLLQMTSQEIVSGKKDEHFIKSKNVQSLEALIREHIIGGQTELGSWLPLLVISNFNVFKRVTYFILTQNQIAVNKISLHVNINTN